MPRMPFSFYLDYGTTNGYGCPFRRNDNVIGNPMCGNDVLVMLRLASIDPASVGIAVPTSGRAVHVKSIYVKSEATAVGLNVQILERPTGQTISLAQLVTGSGTITFDPPLLIDPAGSTTNGTGTLEDLILEHTGATGTETAVAGYVDWEYAR